MAAPAKLNFKVIQGGTFREVIRWESGTKVYKSITNIAKTAPMVVTAVGHNMPIGWRAKISNVLGMKEANTNDEYVVSTDTTADTITFGYINAAGYTTYVSGGILEYSPPTSLSGLTARMQIRPTIKSEVVIATLTSGSGIVLDDTSGTITINIDALTTAAFTFKTAVYSIEIVNGTVVAPLVTGTLTLVPEITRTIEVPGPSNPSDPTTGSISLSGAGALYLVGAGLINLV